MTAIATSMSNDQETQKESRLGNSPSRFTAVNGGENPVSSSALPSNGDSREPAEHWSRDRCDSLSRQDEKAVSSGHDLDERSSQRSTSYTAPIPANRVKRKRSECDDQEGSHEPHFSRRSPTQRTDATAEQSPQAGTSNGVMSSQSDGELKQASPQAPVRLDEGGTPRTSSANVNWHEFDGQLQSHVQRTQQIDATDAQLAEVLQREAQGSDAGQKTWNGVSRQFEGSVQSEQAHASSFSQDRPQNAVQIAPKRKRVFSNRTKTGCLTCRKRKKKCDEQRPACNNCVRGGFPCEGYPSRSAWQKPSTTKAPIPLQSKEGYQDGNGPCISDISQHDRQQTLGEPLDPGKMRPTVIDDDNRSGAQFSTSPTGVGPSRGSWPNRTWPGAAHSGYLADNLAKPDYREVPSIHELSREGHPKNDFQLVPPISQLSHSGHTKPNAPIFQGGLDQRPVHTSSIDTSTPQAQARMALSIEHQLSGRTASIEETEKDKMIRGDFFRPFDVVLMEERGRCKAALWRFNKACNPALGLSAKEQTRLLKEILVPQFSISSPSGVVSHRPMGSFGQGAVVEAPFDCHYGYNINIGEDVMVSESCLFVDDCPITIGAHTWIGPRVTILTAMAHANMQERKGSQSRYQGRPVTIEEDCWVGPGCIIYPGVRLRRGAYVAPGEVVRSDIAAYGFQGLKPSYM
ncbi:hypothetical protein BDV18DRAFT_87374 [Aspergillus unguis]